MIAPPPWREVTTDDFHSRNFPETTIGSAFIRPRYEQRWCAVKRQP